MEKLLQAWFDTSIQGVAFVEPIHNKQGEITDFRYRLVNAALTRLLQKTREEIIGQIVKPTNRNHLFPIMVRVFQTGEARQLSKQYQEGENDVWHDITLTRIDDQLMISVQEVSEQKKSEHRLARRLAIESTISTISSRFITLTEGELNAYIIDALAQISRHIAAERASVFLYSKNATEGSCIYEWCAPGIEPRKERVAVRPRDCFDWTRRRLEKGEVILLYAEELTPQDIEEKAFFNFLAVQSMVAVPLVQEGVVLGFVGFYAITRPLRWDQHDVSVLETFATLVANVRQRLQQEAALQQVNQRLEGLHAIDQALLGYRIAGQAPLVIAMKYVHFMVPCDRIMVLQIMEETGVAVGKCRLMNGELVIDPDFSVPASFFYDTFPKAWTRDQFVHYPCLTVDSTSPAPVCDLYGLGIRSLLAIPLYSYKGLIGAITLASTEPHFFTDDYIQIAQELANPLSIVLYQQQLDKQLTDYTEQLEQRVAERTREISQLSTLHQAILKHAGQAIVSTDTNGFIQTANQAAEAVTEYRAEELIGLVAHQTAGPTEHSVPYLSYKSPEDGLPKSNSIARELAEKGFFYGECVTITKHGKEKPILLAVSALFDEAGTLIGFVSISTDISALKTAEAKLKRTNQEMQAVFKGAIDLHGIADLQGNFHDVNPAWEQTLGYSASELTGFTIGDLLIDDDWLMVRRQFDALTNHECLNYQINQFRKKDGSFCTLEWNAIRVDAHIHISARDITQRQKAEVQLRSLNQRLQLATQAAGQGVWEMDMETNTLTWDEQLWKLHGRRPSKNWKFDNFLKIIHPEDINTFLQASSQANGKDILGSVARIIRPDGAIRYMESSGLLIRNDAGKPTRAIGVVWDITERKVAEEALRESEQRFREIAENVDEIFWIHSAQPFRLLYLNPAYERVWTNGFEALLHNPFAFMETFLEEDRPAVWNLLEHYKRGIEGQLYCRQQEPDGPLRWLFIRTFMIRNDAGQLVRHIGIINDVTDQKEKELVLQQALEREQQLNMLKSQFVSTASHEFRTPLATMQSSIDIIKLYLDLPSETAMPSVRKHLGVIEHEIDQFSVLLSDILTIGTIESGKVSFNPHWVDVVAICEDIINTHFSRRQDLRRVQLMLVGTPQLVYLDEKLISHVVVNLLSNAFKFSAQDPYLKIGFTDSNLIVQVVDRGIGIPAVELATLFQAFFRASNTSGIPGTGLGLVIARQFVELHGGQLGIESEERKGTTCTVTIPTRCPETTSMILADAGNSLSEN